MLHTLVLIFTYCWLAWLGLLALVITLRILTGRLSLGGLLSSSKSIRIDPERVQSLVVFLFVAGLFVIQTIQAWSTRKLPEIPESLLAILAASNGVYLGGKVARQQMTPPTTRTPARKR